MRAGKGRISSGITAIELDKTWGICQKFKLYVWCLAFHRFDLSLYPDCTLLEYV